MSILWADFPSGQLGLYGTSTVNMLDGIWAQVTSNATLVADPDPNIGSNGTVLRMEAVNAPVGPRRGTIARKVLPAAVATAGVGFRMWLQSLPATTDEVMFYSFNNNSNQEQVMIFVEPSGVLSVYRGSIGSLSIRPSTLLGQTASPALTANSWNHVETKVFLNDTTGTVEIRVNGTVVLSLTGLDTIEDAGSTIAQIPFGYFKNSSTPPYYYIKDYVLWDTSGSVGNDFQGSVAVRDLYPDADISLNWTPSTGSTGWNLIDETTPNDADYIQAGDPAPAAYVASLTDLPTDVTSVRALIPIYRSVKTDGGDCNLQLGLTPNNTDWDDGADTPITTAYAYRWDISELSPDTGSAWTPTEVNSAYVRVNRTA